MKTVKTNGDRNHTNGTASGIGRAEFCQTRRGTSLILTGNLASQVRRASNREGASARDWVFDALLEKIDGCGSTGSRRQQAEVRAALETLLAADVDKAGDTAMNKVSASVNVTLDSSEWLALMKTARSRGVTVDMMISQCLAEGCHPALDVTPEHVGPQWED